MDRCWLKGALGDALHALSCAAGYNIRWLMRAIVGLAAKRLCLVFSDRASYGWRISMRSLAIGISNAVIPAHGPAA